MIARNIRGTRNVFDPPPQPDRGMSRAQRQWDSQEGPGTFGGFSEKYANVTGYQGMGENAGIYVERKDAARYALDQCGLAPTGRRSVPGELLDLVEEYFFSGDWLPLAVPWNAVKGERA